MLRLVTDTYLLQQYSMFDDDYIEKMANFYTSEAAKKIFPNILKTPFYDWLYEQYTSEFKVKVKVFKQSI